jgi:glycosyltransferase involved in cell wall biosynthesis
VLRAAIDARDAAAQNPRGWGRYARCLIDALEQLPDLDLQPIEHGWPGPEALFEAAGLPLKARGADVLHVPNCFLPPVRPCPGVVTIHDLAFEDHPEDFARKTALKYQRWTPHAARSAQIVITPSRFTRDDIVRRYDIDPGKVRVIGEAPAMPIGDKEPPPGPYILGVGDLRKKKNWVTLATAYAQLRASGLEHRLVIAGLDAGEGAAIRAAVRDNPLALPGYVTDGELDALIRGADLLVHPSLYEGYGLVLVEAMARGVPVVAANATALPEIAGDAAILFDPLDASALADAIREALADADGLISRGKARVSQLSWSRAATETVDAYRAAVEAARGGNGATQ